eukprot:RCo031267
MSSSPSSSPPLQQAMLLLGPTGVGKSPLGEYLEDHGLSGRRCFHFDFGANLRAVASSGAVPSGKEGAPLDGASCPADVSFTAAEVDFIRDVLKKGLLLENETFGLAAKLLRQFVSRHGMTPEDLLVLNGLPRHAGQARDLREIALVQVNLVVHLRCTAETVLARLAANSGED